MSPIIDIQRRLVEVGRIRLGAKKMSANGKQYPAKLEQFRLTSRDRLRLDAAAALYGGTVRKWEDQWELFTDADALPVAVVPGQALSQSYELWGQKTLRGGKKSAVICLRRCDGVTEHLSGEACLCAAEEEPSCRPTTRLSVVLTEVPGLGVWRVESKGWNSAVELAGSVELLESLVATGRPVRARLRLDRREQKTETETRQFVVPVLDVDHTLGYILDSIGAGTPPPAVQGSSAAAVEQFRPVDPAELAAGPNPSIREQVESGANAEPKAPRANAATPLPATGLTPGAQVVEGGAGSSGKTDAEVAATGPPAAPPPELSDEDAEGLPKGWPSPSNTIAIACREAGLDDDGRHALVAIVTNGRATSSKDLDPMEMAAARAWLVKIKRGQVVLRDGTRLVNTSNARTVAELIVNPDTPGLHEAIVPGEGQPPPACPPPPGELFDGATVLDAAGWLELGRAAGRRQVTILRRARELAKEAGVQLPGDLGSVPVEVAPLLQAWLEEQAS